MIRPPANMTAQEMGRSTKAGRDFVDSIIATAKAIATDSDHQHRMQKCLCKACHYRSMLSAGVAGAACTSRPCMRCGQNQHYASTATDVLCADCAKATDLCKKCGADMELRMRQTWPVPNEPKTSPDD